MKDPRTLDLKQHIIAACVDKKSAKRAGLPQIALKAGVSAEVFAENVINEMATVYQYVTQDMSVACVRDELNKPRLLHMGSKKPQTLYDDFKNRKKALGKKQAREKLKSLKSALFKAQQNIDFIDCRTTSLSHSWAAIDSLLFPGMAQLSDMGKLVTITPAKRMALLFSFLTQGIEGLLEKNESVPSESGPEKSFIPTLLVGKIVRSVASHTKIKLSPSARSQLHSFVNELLTTAGVGYNEHTLQGYINDAIKALPQKHLS
jgi:hypothetical protein